ncbi:MAG: hypothetical protein KGL39_05115 [Patescibacteria group bacterium]|nr:hypothetical protein [Patescibacteria group bacterium]
MKVFASDHAVLRWMERQYGIDVGKYRRDLEALVLPYVAARAMYAPVGDLWAVLDGAKIVTVNSDKPDPRATGKHDRLGVNGTHMRSPDAKFIAQRKRGK